MKRFLFSAAALAVLSLPAVHAQTLPTVKVHFSEAVEVGTNPLPQGDYTITMIPGNGDVPLLRFTADHGPTVVVFAARDLRAADEPASRTEVILDKTGPVERVSRIEVEGSTVDFVLPEAAATH